MSAPPASVACAVSVCTPSGERPPWRRGHLQRARLQMAEVARLSARVERLVPARSVSVRTPLASVAERSPRACAASRRRVGASTGGARVLDGRPRRSIAQPSTQLRCRRRRPTSHRTSNFSAWLRPNVRVAHFLTAVSPLPQPIQEPVRRVLDRDLVVRSCLSIRYRAVTDRTSSRSARSRPVGGRPRAAHWPPGFTPTYRPVNGSFADGRARRRHGEPDALSLRATKPGGCRVGAQLHLVGRRHRAAGANTSSASSGECARPACARQPATVAARFRLSARRDARQQAAGGLDREVAVVGEAEVEAPGHVVVPDRRRGRGRRTRRRSAGR